MTLDYSKWFWPMNEKHLIDENPVFARWSVFGENADSGTVDIADLRSGDNIVLGLPVDKAWRLIAARDQFADAVAAILNGGE